MKDILISIYKKLSIKMILVVTMVAINVYLLTYPSKVLGNIIDLLNNIEANKPEILELIVKLLIASIILIIIRVIWKFTLAVITRTVEKDLRDKLFDHFLRIKLSSIQNIKNGEIMSYFVKDIGEIRGFTYRFLSHASRVFFIFVITIIMMLQIDLSLTIAAICPIAITTYIILILKNYVEKSFKKSQRYFTNLSEYVQESTDAIRTTKAYSGETNQLKKFIKKNRILKMGNIAVDIYSTLLSSSVMICFGFCYGITLIYGSKLVLDNQITIGDFVAFTGDIDLFLTPLFWLPGIISKFKRAQISFGRLDNVFKLEKENLKLEGIGASERISGDIKIQNLSFNYSGNLDMILDDITVEIKKGETLGIIGTIGSGKTTLMNLLLRLYPVQDGKIFIGGQDINEIDLAKLRNSVSYITQDNFLFSSTIKDNISLFRDEFQDKEIEESTELSMISEEIQKMKNGIDTIIGERGIDLSGGQKQRVVISRAFLNKSNIVIFDDTFSALDNKTEKLLLENIKELVKDKTCIIISNRISDIKDANHIIVLDSGKIVEQGTHNELINNSGLYNKFYNQQSSKNEDSILN